MKPARFSGRVRLQSGAPAYGCRVVLRVGTNDTVVTQAWTSSRGEFVLDVPPGRLPAGEAVAGAFALEVVDGTGTTLIREENQTIYAGQTSHLDLVSPRKQMVTLPVALPLLRHHASHVVRPEAIAAIDAAIGLLSQPGSDVAQRYQRAVRATLPPPGHLEELLELSWSALDGDPMAMAALREILAVQGETVRRQLPASSEKTTIEERPQSRHQSYGRPRESRTVTVVKPQTLTGQLLTSGPISPKDDGEDGPAAREMAVHPERLYPLLVATVRISHTSAERAAFFDALHGLLSGLSTLDRLHRAALDVLQERRVAPLRALLALLTSALGSGGSLALDGVEGLRGPGADPNLPDLVDPWWARLQQCVRETTAAIQAQGEIDLHYAVDRIDPPDAAGGATVTILGSGFGSSGGDVLFQGAEPIEPEVWKDDRIEVRVPDDARPGPVTLRVLDAVVRIRKKLVELYRTGEAGLFAGGRPVIPSVLVDGRAEGSWVRPGDAAAVSWTTVSGPQGRVGLQVRLMSTSPGAGPGEVLFEEGDMPASGSRILAIPDVDHEHRLLVRVRVENAVDSVRREAVFPVAEPPTLDIQGVEVTQAIQRAPWDDAPPVPTIAGRDTFVRVYVSSDRGGFQDDQTPLEAATLRVGDTAIEPWPVLPEGRLFVAGRASAIDRARLDHALLFRIPAALCHGTRELRIEVSAAGRPPEAPYAESAITWTWHATRALPVRWLHAGARRSGARGDDPATDVARQTVLRGLDLLPTAPDDVAVAWPGALPPVDGVSPDPRDVLLARLADLRDGAAWEWAASLEDDLPAPDPAEIVVAVDPQGDVRPTVDRDARVCIVPACPPDAGPTDPRRTATARALAALLDPDGPSDGRPLTDVPLDPHHVAVVTDAVHGVHDLTPPPGAAWIAPGTWRALLERL